MKAGRGSIFVACIVLVAIGALTLISAPIIVAATTSCAQQKPVCSGLGVPVFGRPPVQLPHTTLQPCGGLPTPYDCWETTEPITPPPEVKQALLSQGYVSRKQDTEFINHERGVIKFTPTPTYANTQTCVAALQHNKILVAALQALQSLQGTPGAKQLQYYLVQKTDAAYDASSKPENPLRAPKPCP